LSSEIGSDVMTLPVVAGTLVIPVLLQYVY
jgi:hypothetical protein